MKKLLLQCLVFCSGAFFLCCIIFALFGFLGTDYHPSPKTPLSSESKRHEVIKTVRLWHNNTVTTLPLEEYLYGVVAGEMPASFHEEALKAQAVAARTYTVNRSRFKNPEHPDADVCSNPAHCKAYLSPDELRGKFKNNPDAMTKIQASVDATKGEIMLYNGEPISAVFHSTSNGMTENSKDVWGGDVPYLVSVVSQGEEESPRYTQTKQFSPEEFRQKINAGNKNVSFSNNPCNWFGTPERNESGSVRTVSICGVPFSGTEIRTLLDLRSATFEISANEQTIQIVTRGYGHGVGMSQYGANYLAKNGYTYEQILKKYYTGIKLANQK